MNRARVSIDTIATGVPGLDRVLGGGLTEQGLVVGEPLTEYRGIISGIPVPGDAAARRPDGLTAPEAEVLRALGRTGEATPEILAQMMGLPPAEVKSALARASPCQAREPVADGRPLTDPPSDREPAVLRLIASGETSQEIAARLGISTRPSRPAGPASARCPG